MAGSLPWLGISRKDAKFREGARQSRAEASGPILVTGSYLGDFAELCVFARKLREKLLLDLALF